MNPTRTAPREKVPGHENRRVVVLEQPPVLRDVLDEAGVDPRIGQACSGFDGRGCAEEHHDDTRYEKQDSARAERHMQQLDRERGDEDARPTK